jgi:hypothetical protein
MGTRSRRSASLKLDPLPVALEKLDVDEELKAKARRYLECNWSGLRTREDFEQVFANLAVCHSLLGPLNPNYRACLDLLRKGLQSYEKMSARWRQEWFAEDIERVLFGPTNSVAAIFEDKDNAQRPVKEIWPRVKTVLQGVLKGAPPRS